MRIKDMNPKLRKRKIQTWFRAGMQLLFFILFPSMFTAAFNGVKYIFTQIGSGNRIELTSFVAVLLMLCVYTMIFGRFSFFVFVSSVIKFCAISFTAVSE